MTKDIRKMNDDECMEQINELYRQMIRNSADRVEAGADNEDEAFFLKSYMQDSKFRVTNVRGDLNREVWNRQSKRMDCKTYKY